MRLRELTILVVGVGLRRVGDAGYDVRFVCVPTTQQATERLRERRFDLVLLWVDLTRPDTLGWVERLRAAKPFLPVVVITDGEPISADVEARLRQIGVAAVLTGGAVELETWFDQWIASQVNPWSGSLRRQRHNSEQPPLPRE